MFDIKKVKEICERRSQGKWVYNEDYERILVNPRKDKNDILTYDQEICQMPNEYSVSFEKSVDNALFIITANRVLPEAIAEIERLNGVAKEIDKQNIKLSLVMADYEKKEREHIKNLTRVSQRISFFEKLVEEGKITIMSNSIYKPKDGNTYWVVEAGDITSRVWSSRLLDFMYYKVGNCFETRDEASSKSKEVRRNTMQY